MFIREYKKKDSFYSIKVDEDNRVRTTLKAAGTETGRAASSKSFTGTGGNLQTIFKSARIMFCSDEDYILMGPDYAKAESWVVAYLAGCEKMIAALNGEDFHSTNATEILGKPVTKANDADRQLGKKVSHAANYRTTPFRMQKELAKEGYDFTKTKCAELLDAYFLAYPNVRQYQERIIQELKEKDKTLVSPFGRVITFFDFWGDRLFNKACAFKPQSCVGDLTNKAIINYYYSYKERLGDIRLDFLLQVHDQIIWQCHKDDLTWEVIEFLQECMAVPITINGHTFTIPSDFELGLNWKELHEITNQQEFEEVKNKLIEEQGKLKNES
jgi:DNA polymerase-1